MSHKYTDRFVPIFPDAPADGVHDDRLDIEPCLIEDRRGSDVLQARPSAVYRCDCRDCGVTFLYIISVRDTQNFTRRCVACQEKASLEWLRDDAMRKFAKRYAAQSDISLQRLHDHGQVVAVCDCDEAGCFGYQMVTEESLLRDDAVLGREPTHYKKLTELGWPESRVRDASSDH